MRALIGRLDRGRHRLLDPEQPAGVGIEPHDDATVRERDERVAFLADDGGARIGGVGPLGHPLQAERAVEAVEIREPGQKPERMLADVETQRPVAEFHDGGRKRRVARGAGAFARELAERAVDYGECRGFKFVAHRKLGWRGEQVCYDPATKIFARFRRSFAWTTREPRVETGRMARIAIVGPGAIGGIMAAWLGRTGEHEIIVCARRPLAELIVETPTETIVARPRVITDPAQAPTVDWVLVATKTYDSAAAAKWFGGLRAGGAPIAVLQNGVEQRELFAPWVSPEKIVPVLLYCPAERTAPTRMRQRRAARIDVPDDGLGRAFAALFACTPIEVSARADFQTALWRKLGVNVIGVLNTILLQPSRVFADARVAELAHALVQECVAIGRAEGAVLPDDFAKEILEIYRGNPPDSINSLHADRLAGRPMELDARNGVIIRLGRKHGIPTPYNHMAVRLLEAMAVEANG